jgi:hypothetical protein
MLYALLDHFLQHISSVLVNEVIYDSDIVSRIQL